MSNTAKKIIVIGGITGGIGSELARRAGAAGYTVAGFSRNRGGDKLPEDCFHRELDATDSDTVGKFFAEVLEKYGSINAYAHCIGSILLKTIHTISDEEWRNTISQNLDTAFFSARAAVKVMQQQDGGGSIALLSSVAAQAGLPAHEAIGAAKGGIDGLVLSIAASYANRNIRCNAVAPGLVETPLTKGIISSLQARSMSEKMHPLGKIGRPANIASLLLWLCSEDADWVTGQIWSADGGMGSVRPRPKA